MARVLQFARCSECGHASVARGACALCGAPTQAQAAPEDLFDGWRCDCYHCTSTPC